MTIICDDTFVTIPLVSVVVPSYNRKDTVVQTLKSIIEQECSFEYEIIIGDDCSSDGVQELLISYQKRYPEKIKLLLFETNIGLGANWATCVKHCHGKYITNCDNDDYWHNNQKLQLQVDFLDKNTKYGVVHTDYQTHNRATGLLEQVIVSDKVLERPLQKSIFKGKYQFCNATMMYRKELIDKYVPLDDYINYQFTLQDWNTWVILAKYTDFFCMPISTATFGVETESITRPSSYEKLIERFEKEKVCYRYLCELFPDDLPYDENVYDRYVNSVLLNLAFKRGDVKKANVFAKQKYSLGDSSFRTCLAQYRLGVYLLLLMKWMRK